MQHKGRAIVNVEIRKNTGCGLCSYLIASIIRSDCQLHPAQDGICWLGGSIVLRQVVYSY